MSDFDLVPTVFRNLMKQQPQTSVSFYSITKSFNENTQLYEDVKTLVATHSCYVRESNKEELQILENFISKDSKVLFVTSAFEFSPVYIITIDGENYMTELTQVRQGYIKVFCKKVVLYE